MSPKMVYPRERYSPEGEARKNKPLKKGRGILLKKKSRKTRIIKTKKSKKQTKRRKNEKNQGLLDPNPYREC